MAPHRYRWRDLGALLVLFVSAVVINGYIVGLDDHPIHIAYLFRQMDPSYLRGDLLVDAGSTHLSWFWILQAPLVDTFGLEPTYFVLQMLAWLAMLAGLIQLARAMAPLPDARFVGWFACIGAILPVSVFGGILRTDALLLNRSIVLGGELVALALAVRGRAFTSLLLIGLLGNVHLTTAFHTGTVAGCILIFQPRRWPLLGRAVAGGALGLLPLVVMALRAHSPAGEGLDYASWRAAVELAWPLHHFIGWMNLVDFLPLVVATCTLLSAWRRTGATHWLAIWTAVVGLCVANSILTEVLHLRIGTMLHLYESGRLLDYAHLVATPVVFLSSWNGTRREAIGGALVLVAAFVSGVSAGEVGEPYSTMQWTVAVITLLGTALLWRRSDETSPTSRWIPPAWSALVVAVSIAAFYRWNYYPSWGAFDPRMDRISDPGLWCRSEFEPFDAPLPDDQICGLSLIAWARHGLPADAIVAAPPFFTHPIGGLRIRARRSLLVTFKDGGEATFDPVFAARWIERIRAISGETGRSIGDIGDGNKSRDPFARMATLRARYDAGDAARFLELQQRYGVTHVICQRTSACGELGFPVVYEDQAWRVFQMPARHDEPAAPGSPPLEPL